MNLNSLMSSERRMSVVMALVFLPWIVRGAFYRGGMGCP